jgi:hypothetical protein
MCLCVLNNDIERVRLIKLIWVKQISFCSFSSSLSLELFIGFGIAFFLPFPLEMEA